jgi:hypothetical protein
MTLKLFWKADCPKCPAAKASLADMADIEYYSLDEAAGLAEAAFYSVMSTPSLVISGTDGSEVASFRGEIPPLEEISRWL